MRDIDHTLQERAEEAKRQYENMKRELYSVLVQDEYLEFFAACARGECEVYLEQEHCLHALAKQFTNQIKRIYYAIRIDTSRLARLNQRYHRAENSVTVAYELISDEELEKLSADDIVTIYLGEIYHQRWGGVWQALFMDPFFLKSLQRLKTLVAQAV